MRLPRWNRHNYGPVRREHKAPIDFGGRVLIDGSRPGTITGCQGSNYVYVRLEDRIDKAQVRVSVNRLTFLDEYSTKEEPETQAKLKRSNKIEKQKPSGFEDYWL